MMVRGLLEGKIPPAGGQQFHIKMYQILKLEDHAFWKSLERQRGQRSAVSFLEGSVESLVLGHVIVLRKDVGARGGRQSS